MPKLNQKGVVHFVLLILLVAGIGLGVYLVNQKTQLFPRADYVPVSGPIESPSPSLTPTPSQSPSPSASPIPCNPKVFDANTWTISETGLCKGKKLSIKYTCQNKKKTVTIACGGSN